MFGWRSVAAAVAALAVLFIAGSTAFAADSSSKPAAATVQLLAQPAASGKGTILLTGAIGDSGTTVTIAKNGKPTSGGDYSKLSLSKGTIEINQTAFQNKASHSPPVTNQSTCSASLTIRAPVTLISGTGLYKGISGTINLTEYYGFVAPRFKSGKDKGQCEYATRPTASSGLIEGTGKVRLG
jgi:hypothetical protein